MMKNSISRALTLVLSGMLAFPALVSGQASNPGVGTAIGQATPGFYWCKGQQSYRAIGDTRTWLFLESCLTSGAAPVWIWCDDDECEKMLISAAASAHYIGVDFDSATTFTSVRLYKH